MQGVDRGPSATSCEEAHEIIPAKISKYMALLLRARHLVPTITLNPGDHPYTDEVILTLRNYRTVSS